MNKAASELGKMAAGKPKNFSAAERARRRDRLAAARKQRWPKKRQRQNTAGERQPPANKEKI